MTGDRHTTPPLFDLPTGPVAEEASQHHGVAEPLRAYYERVLYETISQQPESGETGYLEYARNLARAVCEVVGGSRWHAEATSPAYPSDKVDQHSQIRITVDERRRVVLTQTNPAGGGLEQWTIAVDGQPIPHRALPGEVPHQVAPVARSVWRHLNEVIQDPCDRLMCDQPATVATYRGSTCTSHAEPTAPPIRPLPATAPAPPLPRPGGGLGRSPAARARASGVRR